MDFFGIDIVKIAWRNVWRNRRRSIVTIAAMTLGLVVMILYAGLMEGYLSGMERNVLDYEVGDVQIFAGDYRRTPSIFTRIEDPEALLGSLEAAGFPATGRLLAFGLAAAEESSSAVSFRGVDVDRDKAVSHINTRIATGKWLDAADPKGVVIGRRLARTLDVDVGGELVAISQGADDAMAYDLFTVRGVLHPVSDATDRTGVFMIESTFREMFVLPEGVHQLVVRRPPEVDLQAAAMRIRELSGVHDVRTWRQLLPTIASLLDSARGAIVAMFVIVYLAIAILILNAMLMAVFERIREIGVLKALGVGPGAVLLMVVAETTIQIGVACLTGLVIAVPSLIYLEQVGIDLAMLAGVSVAGLAMDSVWRAEITPNVIAAPLMTLLTIVFLAVLYPALKAAFIQPVDAMRHHG